MSFLQALKGTRDSQSTEIECHKWTNSISKWVFIPTEPSFLSVGKRAYFTSVTGDLLSQFAVMRKNNFGEEDELYKAFKWKQFLYVYAVPVDKVTSENLISHVRLLELKPSIKNGLAEALEMLELDSPFGRKITISRKGKSFNTSYSVSVSESSFDYSEQFTEEFLKSLPNMEGHSRCRLPDEEWVINKIKSNEKWGVNIKTELRADRDGSKKSGATGNKSGFEDDMFSKGEDKSEDDCPF